MALTEGIYTNVQGRARDYAGNAVAVSGTVSVDTTAPASSWSIGDGTWVRGDVLIGGTSTDATSGLAQVYVSADGGATWTAVGSSSPWTYAWSTGALADTNPLAEGYELQARADDIAGNSESTAYVHLRVDNTPPTLALPVILMGYDPSQTRFLSADAASGLDYARVTFSGNGIVPRVYTFTGLTGNESIAWDGRDGTGNLVAPEIYSVLIEVWDRVGNRTTAAGQWAIVAPPTETPVPTRTATPTRMPDQPGPTDTRRPTGLPGAPTATGTAVPTSTPTPPPPPPPPPPPLLPLGIPLWTLTLPVIGMGVWLTGSLAAFFRDGRWRELRALRKMLASYREQSKTNFKGGESND